MNKKVLALLLTLCMMFTLVPGNVMAEEANGEQLSVSSDEDTQQTPENNASENADEGEGENGETDEKTLSGSGTEDDPYLINNIEDLKRFRDDVNEGNQYVGGVVKLTADIDLADENWTPIGDDTNYFWGTFDGQNHTISNMTININTPDSNVFAGLFGGIKKATVKNLTMENAKIDAVGKKVRAAAVVGIAHSNSENRTDATINFENITVDGCIIEATATNGSALLGGVVGYSYPANMSKITVSDLTINGKAEGNEVRAAAINGYVCGQNISNNGNTRAPMLVDTFEVSNATINAEGYTVFAGGYAPYTYYGYITLKDGNINGLKITVDAHEAFVGGLVGYFWRSDNGHTVEDVTITGIDFDVTTDYLGETRIGGVVGTSQSPNTKYTDVSVSGKIVERCSDSANPVNYHAKVGGFVARTYEYALQTYTNCVADVDVTGSNVAGGFVGNHTSTVSYVNCEAKGDVTANIAGGFAGRLTNSSYTSAVTFDGCSASGAVIGTNVAGGFIGSTVSYGWNAWGTESAASPYAYNVTLTDCEATGTVTSDTDYEAGVVGEAKVADGKELTLDNITYSVEPAFWPADANVKTMVAQVGETKYDSLAAAVEAAEAGATVTLLGNASGAGVVINKNITIDLATYTYTFTSGVGSTGTESNGFQILKDNTVEIKNGTLNVAEANKGNFYILVQNYANLTLTDVTLDGTNLDKWSGTDGDSYTLSNNSGNVVITGKTNIIANDEGDKAFAFDVYENESYVAPTVTITTTGKISGNFEVSEEIKENLVIKSGTFTVDPSAYVSLGYQVNENDGVYGVVENDWIIDNKEELLAFAAYVNLGNNFAGKTVKLNANIDLGGMTWTPIASFAGNFVGNNYTISNFHIDATNADGGFFNVIASSNGLEDVKVKDLILSDVTATVGNKRFGTLANSIQGVVHNVTVKNVTVTTTSTGAWVGGMAAFMSWPWMTNCTVENLEVNAEAGADLIGGFACILQKNSNHVFDNLDVKGFKVTVTDTDSSGCGVGGFVAQTQRGWEYPKVINCDITGIDVKAIGLVDVGGFIAWPGAHTTAENCTTEGKIDVTGVTSADCFAGGFFGNLGWNADLGQMGHEVINCSADVDIITTVAPAGGFVGSATNSNDNSMYATFTNCVAKGDITNYGSAPVGGFAGDADRGVYNNCTASGAVTGYAYAGGFIGHMYDVTPKYDSRYPAGTRDYSADAITLQSCAGSASVTGKTDTTAGMIGFIESGVDVTLVGNSYTCEPEYNKAEDTEVATGIIMIGKTPYNTLAEAVTAANAIDGGATIELYADVTLGEKLTISGDVTISGEYTITWADGYTGTLFEVASGASLTTKNITIDGENEFTFYNDTTTVENGQNWYTRFVNVGEEDKAINDNVIVNAGNLTLGEGTVIKNVTIASGGDNGKTENTESGYVLKYNDDLAVIKSNGGTVNINGASITGNAGMVLNAIEATTGIANTTINGNMGVGDKGGIIIANGGTMTIDKKSSISNNKAMARSATVLGVINGAEVTFSGTMDNNKHIGVGSNTAGAIVVLEGASQFVMDGGSISNNAGGRAGAIASRWVGGDHGQHEETSIVLNAGSITGNTASNDSWNNASVFLRSPATIGEGMTVEGNIAVNTAPGELEITGGTFNGNLIVTDGLTAEITGGTFTQDVTAWLAPDSGLAYDEATGTYDVTQDLYEYNGTAYKTLAEVIAAIAVTPATLADEDTTPVVKVLASHKVDDAIVVGTNLVLDLNGKTITGAKNDAGVQVYPVIRVVNGANVTVKNGEITNDDYVFVLGASDGSSAGNLTIESGKYTGNTTVASVTKGTLTILGGEFAVTNDATYLLNCIDANYKNDSAKIVVKGGTFYKFNPADNAAEGANTNFVAEGYGAKTEDEGATYTVTAAETIYIEWIKEELLAGRDVTLDRDVVVDGSYITSEPHAVNSNGKYPNYGIFTVLGDHDVTIDLNGHDVTYNGHATFEWNGKTYNSCAVAHGLFFANGGADLTIKDSVGTSEITVYGLASGAYVATPDTTLTIEGGTWKNVGCAECGGTNIFLYPLQGGELYIKGGRFEQALDSEYESYLIVEHGGEYKNSVIDYSKTKVEISGGTFVGMNPADIKKFNQTAGNKLDTTTEPTTNGCASTYVPVENDDGTYGVEVWNGETISNKYELLAFAEKANSGNTFSGKTVKLLADIDLGGMTWTPIKSFAGTFDGGNHTISNFKLDGTNGQAAFFASLGQYPATVKDLTLSDVDGTAGSYRFAILAATGHTSIVTNVHIKNAKVTTVHKDAKVGAIYGYFNWTSASNCTIENFEVDATAGAMFIGGFAAWMDQDLTMDNVDINGFKVVVSDTDNDCAVGGFTAQTQTGHRQPTFANCDITGLDITATGTVDVGGFIADPGAHTIVNNCTVTGEIDATGITNGSAGGFLADYGWNNNESNKGGHKLTNCVANVNIVTKTAPAGGFVGSATNDNNRDMPATLTGCEATGTVTLAEGGTANIGGFAGEADRGTYNNCSAAQDPFFGNVPAGKVLNNINSYIASVNGVYYADFSNALAAAKDGDVKTIVMQAPLVLTEDTTLDLTDVKIDGNGVYPVIRVQNGANVTVKGGEIINATDYIFVLGAADGSSEGNLTIESGKYTGNTTVASVTKGTLTINGGEFAVNSESSAYLLNCIDANYNNGTAKIVVKGGTFHKFNPENNAAEGTGTNFVAEGYKAVDNSNDTYGVEQIMVAEVNGTKYDSLQAAIDAAVDDDVIKVIADIDLANTDLQTLDGSYDTYFKVEGKTVTIDLNGKTISGAYTGDSMLVGAFSTDNNGHITLTGNGTVNVTATKKVYSLIANYEDECSITIENGTYTLDAAYDNLIYSGCNVNDANTEGVYVKGGTFTLGNVGTGENGKPWIFNALGANERHVIVTGGTFNADVFNQPWIWEVQWPDSERLATKANANGTWTVVPATAYVAREKSGYTRNVGYATLADAVADADDNETVTLLTDTAVAETVVIEKNITLDLGGKTVSATAALNSAPVIRVLADVTVKNGTVDGTTGINSYAFIVGNNTNAGTLNIADGTYKGITSAISITNGTANISGGTFSTAHDDEGTDYGTQYLLNCMDAAYKAGTAVYNITGGTFVGFNPENNAAEGEGTNFVAEGYLAEEAGGNYTVRKANYVAEVNRVKFESLAAAIKAANVGDTIVFLADIEEDVTVNKNLTIDGADKNYTGTMTVSTGKTVTIQNVNFVKGCITEAKGTSGNLTVKNCDFDGVDNSIAYAVTMRGGNSITVEGGTVKNYDYGFLYIPSAVSNVNVKDTTVEGMNYGVHVAYGNKVNLDNVKMTGTAYGIMTQNYGAKTITIKNCEISGTNPIHVWERNTTVVDTFKFEGNNTFSALTASAQAKLVFTETDATLTAPEGYNVTTNVENHLVKYDNGTYKVIPAVAKIGETIYATVSEALEKAEEVAETAGVATVTLLANAEADVVIVYPGVTLDLNGNTLTANHVIGLNGSHVIDNSADNTGLLKTGKDKVSLDLNNAQLPAYVVENGVEGYKFFEIEILTKLTDLSGINETTKKFEFLVDRTDDWDKLYTLFADKGAEDHELAVMVEISWTNDDAGVKATQRYVYMENMVVYVSSQQLNKNGYGVFTCQLDEDDRNDVTYSVVFVSNTGAEFKHTRIKN